MTGTESLSPEAQLIRATSTPALFARHVSRGLREPFRIPKHIAEIDRAIVETISGRGPMILVIEAPPRHGKSELICKHLPPWYLGTFPDRKVILAMNTFDSAKEYGQISRDILEEHGPEVFGVTVRSDSSAAGNWKVEGHAGGMFCAGTSTTLPGRGAHLLIIDDPIRSAEEAMSDTRRIKLWNWWMSSARTRLSPDACVIVISTRWHEDDLSGRLIRDAETEGGFPVRRLTLTAIAEDNDALGRQPGEALWPSQWPLPHLLRIKAGSSPYFWNALYRQAPSQHEGAEWPDTYFGEHIWAERWPDAFELTAIGVDPSKGKNHGDYSGITFVGLAGGILWCDCSLERRPPEQIVSDGINMAIAYRPDAFAVESNAFQEMMAPEFDRQCRERGIPPLPLCLTENRVNKELRIGRLGPYLMRQQLRFRDTPGCRKLVQQLREFPLSEHDDGPDSLELAIRTLREIPNLEDQGGYDYAAA